LGFKFKQDYLNAYERVLTLDNGQFWFTRKNENSVVCLIYKFLVYNYKHDIFSNAYIWDGQYVQESVLQYSWCISIRFLTFQMMLNTFKVGLPQTTEVRRCRDRKCHAIPLVAVAEILIAFACASDNFQLNGFEALFLNGKRTI